MSTVQLYCHSCKDVVSVGSEEFTCSRCNGGFVELYESQRLPSSGTLGASNSSLDEDDDPIMMHLDPLLMMQMQAPSAFRSSRIARLPNAQRSSQVPMDDISSTPEEGTADPRASNSQPDMQGTGSSRTQSNQPTRTYDPMRLNLANSRRIRVGLTSRASTSPQVSASASAQQPTNQTGVSTDLNASRSARSNFTRRGAFFPHAQSRSQVTSRSPTSNDAMENFFAAIFGGVGQADVGATAPGGAQVPPQYMPLGQLFPFAQLFPPLHGNPGDYVFSEQGIDNVITQLLGQLGSSGGPPPAAPEVLERLPDAHITAEQTQDGLQCFVCFEEFSKDEKVKRLPCGHHYHTDCIMPWLEQHGTCPVCRKTLEGVDTTTYSIDHFVRGAEAAPNSSTETAGVENRNENESDVERDSEQYFDAPEDADSSRDPPHPGYFS